MEPRAKSAKNSFLSGVALLTLSAAAVKLIGVFYKIPLVRLVGIEGMAYFLAAYHIYTLLFMISTSGLPVAVSILVSRRVAAGDRRGAEAVFSCSLRLFSVVGLVFGLLMFCSSELVAASIKIPEAALSIRAIAPSLFFIAVGSAVRGYFQGLGDMKPTAVSQVIESAGKLVLGLLFAHLAILRGASLEATSAAAIFGISAGSALSAVYLLALKLKKGGAKLLGRAKGVLFEILRIAAPITLGAAVVSLSGVVDTALVSSRLQMAGLDPTAANSMYSSYGNLSLPLFNLVPSFISPIAVAVTPLLAEARERGDRAKENSLISSAMRLCALIAIPACFGLAIFGEHILGILYPDQKEAIAVAAPLLSFLSPAVLFSCLITVTNSLLQAYGEERKTIISTAAGISAKILIEYFLISLPGVNIFGAPISTLACDLIIVCLNLCFFTRVAKPSDGTVYLMTKPLLASLPASIAATAAFFAAFRLAYDGRIAFFAALVADVALYAVLALFCGAVTEDDLNFLPAGEKIIKIMKKIRLLRNDNE